MKFSLLSLSPKFFIFALLILVGVPVTVFLVSQNQNLSQQANESPYPKCAPDGPESGWPECRYGQPTHNTQACRTRAENWKGVDGPHGQGDAAWFTWAQDPPKPLSCGTACGLAPSFCIVNNSPTPQPSHTPVPSNTPKPQPSHTPVPSNTPKPQPSHTPVPSNTPKPQPSHTPVPSNTPKPQPSHTPVPSNTPKPTATPMPSVTPDPTATDVPPTPTETISSCPVPRTPASGMNIRIVCPYCDDE